MPAAPPDPDEHAAAEDEIDPREALVRRLLEYQKYKLAGEELAARGVAGRDVFGRGATAESLAADPDRPSPHAGPPPLAAVPLFTLVDAFQRVLDRSKVRLAHDVVVERVSLGERIGQISDLLAARGRVTFDAMFDAAGARFDVVITFLALLEMTRLRMTRLFQSEPLGQLYVELAAQRERAGCPPPDALDGARDG